MLTSEDDVANEKRGNNDASDPNFNANGPYDQVAQRLGLVVTVGGAHRGSQGADAVCLQSNILCSFIAIFIQSCDDATYWLRSSDDVQVRTYANAPAKTIYLTGGYKAISRELDEDKKVRREDPTKKKQTKKKQEE